MSVLCRSDLMCQGVGSRHENIVLRRRDLTCRGARCGSRCENSVLCRRDLTCQGTRCGTRHENSVLRRKDFVGGFGGAVVRALAFHL